MFFLAWSRHLTPTFRSTTHVCVTLTARGKLGQREGEEHVLEEERHTGIERERERERGGREGDGQRNGEKILSEPLNYSNKWSLE